MLGKQSRVPPNVKQSPCDPGTGTCPRELRICVHANTCTWTFIATSVIIARKWKLKAEHAQCPTGSLNPIYAMFIIDYDQGSHSFPSHLLHLHPPSTHFCSSPKLGDRDTHREGGRGFFQSTVLIQSTLGNHKVAHRSSVILSTPSPARNLRFNSHSFNFLSLVSLPPILQGFLNSAC